jgi:hypothetical protein
MLAMISFLWWISSETTGSSLEYSSSTDWNLNAARGEPRESENWRGSASHVKFATCREPSSDDADDCGGSAVEARLAEKLDSEWLAASIEAADMDERGATEDRLASQVAAGSGASSDDADDCGGSAVEARLAEKLDSEWLAASIEAADMDERGAAEDFLEVIESKLPMLIGESNVATDCRRAVAACPFNISERGRPSKVMLVSCIGTWNVESLNPRCPFENDVWRRYCIDLPRAIFVFPIFVLIWSSDRVIRNPAWRESEEYESMISKHFIRPRETRWRSSQQLTPLSKDTVRISGSSEGELWANICKQQKQL